MKITERYQHILNWFQTHHPVAETELHYTNPYELLVAVILSAQCTDKRVNMVTPALFERFPGPQSLALAETEEIFEYIRSISYPNNKAKHLAGMGRMLVQNYSGEVPDSVEELQKLPGVGRKTANVIVSVVFEQPAMAVDTHVFRVSRRLGLTTGAKTPLQAEQQLMKHIPRHLVHIAHHWIILHGRYICTARNPKCPDCGLKDWCKEYAKNLKKSTENSKV
jgi:endonuclease-3